MMDINGDTISQFDLLVIQLPFRLAAVLTFEIVTEYRLIEIGLGAENSLQMMSSLRAMVRVGY